MQGGHAAGLAAGPIRRRLAPSSSSTATALVPDVLDPIREGDHPEGLLLAAPPGGGFLRGDGTGQATFQFIFQLLHILKENYRVIF